MLTHHPLTQPPLPTLYKCSNSRPHELYSSYYSFVILDNQTTIS